MKKIAIPQQGPQTKLTKLYNYGHKISKRLTQTDYNNNKPHTLAIKLAIIMYSDICYSQLQKYLRHCTVFWHKWPDHDLVLVTPPPPLIKVASNIRKCSKRGGTTLNGREEGDQYYISQTCDQERFEARKVGFSWECNWLWLLSFSSTSLVLITVVSLANLHKGAEVLACYYVTSH